MNKFNKVIDEPILKKKSLLNRILHNQIVITLFTTIMVLFVVIGSSYAIFSRSNVTGLEDVVITTGDLQVVLSSDDEMLNINYTTLGVTDEVGLSGSEYTFSVTNTGTSDVNYYEIRIVDKEYEISTLPHKAIKFAINRNNEGYSEPLNLADNGSYIFTGETLAVGATDTFNLKLWVSNELGEVIKDKVLNSSLEVTLYQEFPTRNYIVYDVNGGEGFIPKTNINAGKISLIEPKKEGYIFKGWSSSSSVTEVNYLSGDNYTFEAGIVLYAVYEPKDTMSTFPTKITEKKSNITEVYFINDTQSNIDALYEDSSIKVDLTYNNLGSVKGWLENDYVDTNGVQYYKLYIGSEGKTYLSTGKSLFSDFENLSIIDFTNADTSMVNDMSSMFGNCNNLIDLDLSNFDTSNVIDMSSMFADCWNLLRLNIIGFNTYNVTNMSYMFDSCGSLTSLNVNSFNTSNVTNMSYIFNSCDSLTSLDVRNFDTSNVTNMSGMFRSCDRIESLNLSNFDTGKVESMGVYGGMFAGCSSLVDLDISGFVFDETILESYNEIFNGMPTTATITVRSITEQSWVLALTGANRPLEWTESNVVLKK